MDCFAALAMTSLFLVVTHASMSIATSKFGAEFFGTPEEM
jgi:hypothetical protein